MSKSSSAAIRSFFATFVLCLGLSCDQAAPDQRAPTKELYGGADTTRIEDVALDGAGNEDRIEIMSEDDPPEPHGHKESEDPCGVDAMFFEGECHPKTEVNLLVEQREGEALENVYLATEPKDKIEATHALIEQQVLQAQKTEKDLDEIILLLEREKALKEGFFEPSLESQASLTEEE